MHILFSNNYKKVYKNNKAQKTLKVIVNVGVLGPEAHYPRECWVQSLSRGLKTAREGENVIKGAHVSE